MKNVFKKLVSTVILVALSASVCLAASEGSLCRMTTTPTILYSGHSYVYCGYLLDLIKQRDSVGATLVSNANTLKTYDGQLAALNTAHDLSIQAAVADGALCAGAIVANGCTVGALTFIDAMTAADLLVALNDIHSTNTSITSLKSKMITLTNSIKSNENTYNSLQTKINYHIANSGHLCYKYVR